MRTSEDAGADFDRVRYQRMLADRLLKEVRLGRKSKTSWQAKIEDTLLKWL